MEQPPLTVPPRWTNEAGAHAHEEQGSVQINVNDDGDLILSGALALRSCGELRHALRASLCARRTLRVDVSGVAECDAAALQVLCSALKTAQCAAVTLEWLAPSPALVEAATALGLSLLAPAETDSTSRGRGLGI